MSAPLVSHWPSERPSLRSEAVLSSKTTSATPSDWITLGELPPELFAERSAVASALAGPHLAHAWSSAVVMYWSRLERLGGLDLTQPLYVFNLGPANGALAAVMLMTLSDEMHARGMLGWPVRFVLCSRPGEDSALAVLKQPALQPFVERGWLDQASWHARPGHALLLGTKRFALFGSRNPVVAVTGGGFSALPTELYGVHYGDLLQARVKVNQDNEGRFNLYSEWQTLEVDTLAPAAAVILDHYRASLISAAVLISEPALSMLDALADFSAGRYLLLAADYGVADERDIRLNHMALTETIRPGELEFPVNFHAVGMHQENAGARMSNRELDHSGYVQHIACRDDVIGIDPDSWDSLVNKVDEVHPAERWWHTRSSDPVKSIDEINFRLRCSGHDPWVLQTILDNLDIRLLDVADGRALQTLRRCLARTWQQMTLRQRGDAGLGLAELLIHVGQWDQAREVLGEISDSESPAALRIHWLLLRARLEAETGRSATALRLLRECLRMDASHPGVQDMYLMLEQRIANWQTNKWFEAEEARDEDLSLEPLDALHIPAWLYQYRDPNIASMAGLPTITDEAEAKIYLDRIGNGGIAEYAVVHRKLGLVGAIGLCCEADMAHIHFWIGVDHQGAGFGARALRLLISSLTDGPVRHLFTSVLEGNMRSRRLLEKAGFDALEHKGLGQDACYIFMHLALTGALTCSDADLEHRLAAVCERIGEPLVR